MEKDVIFNPSPCTANLPPASCKLICCGEKDVTLSTPVRVSFFCCSIVSVCAFCSEERELSLFSCIPYYMKPPPVL